MSSQNELKKTIDAIIATDKKAREATEKVRESAENSGARIKQRADAVRDEYMSRALRRIDVIQKVESEYADGEWQKTQEQYKAVSDALDKRYAEMGEKWVDELVKNVIEAN